MNDRVKETLGRLARAINDELTRSERIEAVVHELQEMGYEFSLYLEATLLLKQLEGDKPVRRRGVRAAVRSGSLRLSEKDVRFLKSLRISLDSGRGKKK